MVASGKVDELVPLLVERDVQSGSADSPVEAPPRPSSRRRKDTPLPILQLLVLAFVRLAEPVSFTQIFPYINQMIEDLGLAEPANVGYYSGLVDSTFSFAQFLTVYFWSSLSDRIGRKPVIMIGVTGATLSSACFGFSESLGLMIFSRALAGALSGNVAVISSMLSEMTDETNQGKVFPLVGATWSIGCVIGPMLGGHLSNPMRKWPQVFEHLPIFQRYPYLLPCVISSAFSVLAIIMCGLFVEETLPSKVAAKKAQRARESLSPEAADVSPLRTASQPDRSTPAPPSVPKATVMSHLSHPHIQALLASTFLIYFLGVGFEVIFVLFSYTRIDLGGMQRSPVQIGSALAGSGAVGAIVSIVIFPWIQRRFNNRKLYTVLVAFWWIPFGLIPLGHLAAKRGESMPERKADALSWAAIIVILIPVKIAVNVYPLNMILTKASVDDPSQLGSLFGLQQALSSISRGLAPGFVSSFFAYSIEHPSILGGNLVWVVLAAIAIAAIPISSRVRDLKAFEAPIEDEEEGLFETALPVGPGLESGHTKVDVHETA